MVTSATPEMARMSLLEHLEEFRRRVVYALIALAVGFGVCWRYSDRIFEWVQKPITEVLVRHHLDPQLVYTNPAEPFNLYLKIGLLAGVFLASPIILYQLWMFISPGLYRNEKKYVLPFMFSTVLLFLAGGAFSYKLAFPAAMNFFIENGSHFKAIIHIDEYMDLFMTVVIGMGIVFEFPILVFFLALMGVVNARWLWSNLRYSILIIFVVAAIVTPTTDILNMCLFAAPLCVLYLFSIGIAWLVHPSRRNKKADDAA